MTAGTDMAFLFPGQGAQAVGMGKDLYAAFPAAKEVFDQAEQITALPIRKLCFEGPEDDLNRTDAAQPAIFTVSAAFLACMENLLSPEKVAALRPAWMAGLSLGEYTALFAAGRLAFADALRLVVRRGSAMQSAATAVPSGMVCVLGLDEAKVLQLCQAAARGRMLVPANFNCPGQVVVSGQQEACKRIEQMAKDFGASGAVPLSVAGAFHSPLMKPAADELAEALDAVAFGASGPGPSPAQAFAAPEAKVVANVDSLPHGEASQVRQRLLSQLTSPVRWQHSMEFLLAQGVRKFYEIGPGRVLAGLMRRIERKAEVVSINSRETLEKLVRSL